MKRKKIGEGEEHKAYTYLTLLGVGHEPAALNSATIVSGVERDLERENNSSVKILVP